MRSRPVAAATTLASSVLPTPAGPSTKTGFSRRSARKTTVEMFLPHTYPHSRRRDWTLSIDSNIAAFLVLPDRGARELAHEMEHVAELFFLGPKIVEILRVGLHLERDAFHDREAVALDAGALAGVVGDEAHLAHPEVDENLCAHPVVAQVRREAEALVGLHRVQALVVLQRVGLDLVLEPDPPALLAHVEDDPPALLLDHLHGRVELLATIAALGAEGVAGQALAVNAHEHGVVGADLTFHQSHVIDMVDVVLVHIRAELSGERGGKHRLGRAAHQLLVAQAVLDQVRNGDDLEAVVPRKADQVDHTGHGPVVVHDLADHPGWLEAGQPRQVHGALGLARPTQHAAVPGAQGEDVSGAHEVLGFRVVRDRALDRGGTVRGRDPCRDPLPGLDRHGEGGAIGGVVVVVRHHHAEAELAQPLLGQREADEPAPEACHEVDGFGARELGGHAQVALVLTVLVVDQDHHAARGDLGDRHLHGHQHVAGVESAAAAAQHVVGGAGDRALIRRHGDRHLPYGPRATVPSVATRAGTRTAGFGRSYQPLTRAST